MNYRSISDLASCITRNLHRVPSDVDVIVGVPRSGMLAASILALLLNRPLTDVDGFLKGRSLLHGRTRTHLRLKEFPVSADKCKLALVVDDSITSGRTIAEVRRMVEDQGLTCKVLYCAVYATRQAAHCVDIAFDVCSNPRLFEWNYMHHRILQKSCVALDGIICPSFTAGQCDGGASYLRFLDKAAPLFLPTVRVGYIVSIRTEEDRKPTEEWLRKHHVEYGELVFLEIPADEVRQGDIVQASFKAHEYKKRRDAILFVESVPAQAEEIARLVGKPVLSVADGRMAYPGVWSPRAVKRNVGLAMRQSLGQAAKAILPARLVSKIRARV